jgi:hypothetical protein
MKQLTLLNKCKNVTHKRVRARSKGGGSNIVPHHISLIVVSFHLSLFVKKLRHRESDCLPGSHTACARVIYLIGLI